MIVKIVADHQAMYALTDARKLWRRNPWHPVWEDAGGPAEHDGSGAIPIKDIVFVHNENTERDDWYVLTVDGRLFEKDDRMYPGTWTEIPQP